MTFTVTCRGCGTEFQAGIRSACWCSERCRSAYRKRTGRSGVDKTGQLGSHDPGDQAPSALVTSVTAELQAAGVLDTFAGQLAVTLAARLDRPGVAGASSLSRELRSAMAAALDGRTPPADADDQDRDQADDELERIRRAREAKARQLRG